MVQWTSFKLVTGTVIVRAQLANNVSSGMQSILWFLGADCQTTNPLTPDNINGCNWHAAGSEEVDFMELDGGGLDQNLFLNDGVFSCTPSSITASQATSGFHNYEMRLVAGTSLRFFVDGVATGCMRTASDVPAQGLFLIMDNTIRSGITGLPSIMFVDFVKVCSDTDGSCTPDSSTSGQHVTFFDDFTDMTVI